MKLNNVNNEYQLRSQDTQRCHANEQHHNNDSLKSKSIYPQDRIDLSTVTKQSIQSTDRTQVELTYSLPLKKVSAEIINKDGVRIEIKNENLPKELQKINSPEVFNLFLKNTYAKVTSLSDGEYKLDVNHRLLGGVKDDPEGSMTPRTQGGKEFNITSGYTDEFCKQNLEKLLKEKETLTSIIEPTTFVRKCVKETEKALEALKIGVIFKQVYQQNIRKKDLTNFVDLTDKKPKVIRYGINPSALGIVVEQPFNKKIVHPIEKDLLQLAGEYLNKVPNAESVLNKESKLYPNNVVLVDIFVRDNEKIKEYQDSGYPETHTVALWKKTDTEYLLIDPSKVDFSKDLAQEIGKILSISIKVHSPTGNILYGTGGKDTSYNELKSISIGEHKHRDCVDIATKVGFEINELQTDDNITKLDEVERAMNLQISNQKKVATFLTNTNDGQPIRASQSSDPIIRYNNRPTLELMK